MTATQPITVGNPTFLVDRLGMDCAPFQYIRELTQNAIEAIAKRRETGWAEEGHIVWDVDWTLVESHGIYKLQISDNGIGMTGPQIEQYINSLSSSGGTQGYAQNFGVGAKIAAGKENPEGLVYKSWTGATGVMATFWKDPDVGYGLQQLQVGEEFAFHAPISDHLKCHPIDDRGTTVTLFGSASDENTYFRETEKQKWLIQYLNSRYFDLPDGVTIKVRDFSNASPAEWPKSPDAKMGRGGSQMRTIRGMHDYLANYSEASGTVDLDTATAHWFLLPEDMNVSGGVWDEKSHMAALFQGELYDVKRLAEARSELVRFGVTYGSSRVVIYVEPNLAKLEVVANTARSSLLVTSGETGTPLPWAEWSASFRSNIPDEIKQMMDEILSKADTGDYRDEIKKRIKEIRDIFNISRYRRTKKGKFTVTGEAPGGSEATTDSTRSAPTNSGTKDRVGGRASTLYGDFVTPDGDPGRKVASDDTVPQVVWITAADGTREEGDLEDRAAKYLPEDNVIQANADFRWFLRILELISLEYPYAEPSEVKRVVEFSVALQLVEAVIGIQNLKGSPEWAGDASAAEGLTPEALTAVVMSQSANLTFMKRQVASIVGAARTNHQSEDEQ